VLTTADGRTLVVRSGVMADARDVRRLIDAVAAEPGVPLLATPGSISLRDVKGLIAKGARDPGSVFLVAEVAGRMAGNLGGSGLAFAPSAHVFEFGMSVDAAYRGVGVGAALLEAALAWAAGAGFTRVELSVFPHNTRAIAFYERHGFTFEGSRPRRFRRAGRYFDEQLMGRTLGAAAEPAAAEPAAAGSAAAGSATTAAAPATPGGAPATPGAGMV
jgi:RimJ/RimL family protein N-acetyltransferase